MTNQHQLKFRVLSGAYAIVRLNPDAVLPEWAARGEFTSVSRTGDELSVVCPTAHVPSNIPSPHRWVVLKLEGPFPFSVTGVLVSFLQPLSSNKVPIFAISTYDTDYVLVQEEYREAALELLQGAGHQLIS
jgi:hypothetical protein